jgi:quercetin dioxygenase-like cupin family protein
VARVGTRIENAAEGDSVIFVETGEDGSPTLVLDMTTTAGASGPPEHLHPGSTELFEVQDGALVVQAGGRSHLLMAGEAFTVEAGVRHKFMSHPELDGRTRVTLDVTGQMEDILVTLYELARAGRVNSKGLPSMQQIAVTGYAIQKDLRPTIAPWAAQQVIFALLRPLGWAAGGCPGWSSRNTTSTAHGVDAPRRVLR